MINIVLYGGPGSGKGTHSGLIEEKYGLKHLSTGDLLRAEIAAGSELGKEAQGYISAGNLVPDEMILRLLGKAVDGLLGSKGVIFDGYPRNVAQAAALDKVMADRGEKVTKFLELVNPDEILVQRMQKRARESSVVRADDTPEVFQRRIALYHEQTDPIVAYYKEKGIYQYIDGKDGLEPTFAQIVECLDNLQ